MSYEASGLGPILYVPAGASARFRAALSRADSGAAIDLTGATAIEFIVKRSAYLADSEAEVTKTLTSGITVIDALAGLVEIALAPADTAEAIPYGAYFYLVRATLLGGEVVIPDFLRGALYLDHSAALNQAANGDALICLSPATGTLTATAPSMANYLLNRYDLAGLTGGAATDLDGLPTATLAALSDGAQAEIYLTGGIVARYRLAAKGSDVETAPWIIVCDNASTRAWRLQYVFKEGLPCSYNTTSQKWYRNWSVGADGSAQPSQDATGFTLPT